MWPLVIASLVVIALALAEVLNVLLEPLRAVGRIVPEFDLPAWFLTTFGYVNYFFPLVELLVVLLGFLAYYAALRVYRFLTHLWELVPFN